MYIIRYVILCSVLMLTACGGADEISITQNTIPSDKDNHTPALAPPLHFPDINTLPIIDNPVQVQGQATYDFIPHQNDIISGLDYENIQIKPIRAAYIVAVMPNTDDIVAITTSDNNGFYSLNIPRLTNVVVRVYSSICSTITNPKWSGTVADNTNNNQRYFIESHVLNIDTVALDINIHAASGWLGDGYIDKRQAAPFAVLDTLYIGFKFIENIDNTIQLPELLINWSEHNRPVMGNIQDGNIRTSTFDSASNTIFLLGAQDVDTDEYDQGVIIHEFWHFLEKQLFKSHNIGGPHSETDILDMRVAFSEGAAHAAAGIMLNMDTYIDTVGTQQIFANRLFLEGAPVAGHNKGWFSRSAVHLILYDMFDANPDEGDFLSLGFEPIYRVLTSSDFIHGDALVTLYKFAEVFAKNNPNVIDDFTSMLNYRGINSLESFGEGENYRFDSVRFLPLYVNLVEQNTKTFCTSNTFGEPNKLDNYKFIKLTIDEVGEKNIILTTNDRVIKDIHASLSFYRKSKLINTLNFDLNQEKTIKRYNFTEVGTYVLTYNESDKVDNKRDDGFPECVDLYVGA